MIPVFAWVVLACAVTTVVFWDEIREWAATTVADAIGRHFGPGVREAFLEFVATVDKVVTNVRRVAARVAAIARSVFLGALVAIERRSRNKYVKMVTSYLRKKLEYQPEQTIKVVSEEAVPFEDLPDEVRREFIMGRSVPVLQLTPQLAN